MRDPDVSNPVQRDDPGGRVPASVRAMPFGDPASSSTWRRVALLRREGDTACAHELAAARAAGERIADRLGLRCDVFAAPCADAERCFWIPLDTLSSREWVALGPADEARLWGGVVPFPHVATKLVSHPLWRHPSRAPEGWRDLPGIAACTLPGYSVFARNDAAAAGHALLADGAVRVKCPYARGGHGQQSIDSAEAFSRWLDGADASLFDHGVVIERDLVDAVTYSVGSSRLPGGAIAYHGEQHTVADHAGAIVYGGSRLVVRRGGLAGLQAAMCDGETAEAVAVAARYDRAVCDGYGVIATRRNYDVIAGVDDRGRRHLGVLEQSWRIGGASMAEVLALEHLARHPQREQVVAETVESYDAAPPPADAVVYWSGDATTPCKYARIVHDGC